jgi:AmmeMemoRadiSam system protein B/AmmeMemoRadiSam system protein A
MKKMYLALIFIAILTIIIICIPLSKTGFFTKQEEIREPVFAGSWYPADKVELTNLTESYLGNYEKKNFNGKIKALIVPHAGYVYSGQVAATAFKQLDGNYKNVFLIGPSHKYYLTNVSVSNFDYYSTPLGNVKVSDKAEEMDEKEEIISNVEEAHENEHALEVELPFLQIQLKSFEIIPLIVGESDTNELKNILIKYLGKEDLIVVSADLSHYHEYNEALALDAYTVSNIMNLDSEAILNSEIDAPWAVSSLLKIAKEKSWKPYFLGYANSGDVTGDKSSVVGYSAIVFVEENVKGETFNEEQRQFLLNLARRSAEEYLKEGKRIEISEKDIPESLKDKKGCFVTFIEDEQLRGCIGYILPKNSLYECVIDNAINAAIKDERFNPVIYEEMKNIKIDVSVLSVPFLLEHTSSEELLSKLKPLEHGVILQRGTYQSTYLPSVWNQIPDKEDFLSNLCIKGNMEAECWKDMETEVYVYTAEDFSE